MPFNLVHQEFKYNHKLTLLLSNTTHGSNAENLDLDDYCDLV